MQPAAERARPWLHAEVLRRAVIDAAIALEPEGIELMAIKGIYLVHVLGVDPAAREMLDADAIVVRGSFPRAVRTMTSTGQWVAYQGWSSKTLARTGDRAGVIDLHRMALPLFFGRMRSSALRSRALRPAVFDGKVLVPDPDDAACLAVAHYVKDSLGAQGHGGLRRDLEWLADRGAVTPASLAARLREHRLRRVGLVAFTAVAQEAPGWTRWLDALAPRRTERVTSRAAVEAVHRASATYPDLAFLLVRTLGDDPAISACGFAATAARLLRDRARRLWRQLNSA